MFGISFGELLIIGVVGLVVLGPERLPAVARTLGRLMRQVQDYTNAFKDELNRELHNAEILELEKELKAEGRKLHSELTQEFGGVRQQLDDTAAKLQEELWHRGPTRSKAVVAASDEAPRQTINLPLDLAEPGSGQTAAAQEPIQVLQNPALETAPGRPTPSPDSKA